MTFIDPTQQLLAKNSASDAGPVPTSKEYADRLKEWAERRAAEREDQAAVRKALEASAATRENLAKVASTPVLPRKVPSKKEIRRQAMRKAMQELAAMNPEEHATVQALAKMKKHLKKTNDVVGTCHAGFAAYRQHGGKKSFTAFKTSVVSQPTS